MKKITLSRNSAKSYEIFLDHPSELLNFFGLLNKKELSRRYVNKVAKMLNYFPTIRTIKREIVENGIAIKIVLKRNCKQLYLIKGGYPLPFLWTPQECYVSELIRFLKTVEDIAKENRNLREIVGAVRDGKYYEVEIQISCTTFVVLKYHRTMYVSVFSERPRGMNYIIIEKGDNPLFIGNVVLIVYGRDK